MFKGSIEQRRLNKQQARGVLSRACIFVWDIDLQKRWGRKYWDIPRDALNDLQNDPQEKLGYPKIAIRKKLGYPKNRRA